MLVGQLPQQKSNGQCRHHGLLFLIGRTAVTTFDVLVIKNVMALFQHPRHHLSGMARMDTIVLG